MLAKLQWPELIRETFLGIMSSKKEVWFRRDTPLRFEMQIIEAIFGEATTLRLHKCLICDIGATSNPYSIVRKRSHWEQAWSDSQLSFVDDHSEKLRVVTVWTDLDNDWRLAWGW